MEGESVFVSEGPYLKGPVLPAGPVYSGRVVNLYTCEWPINYYNSLIKSTLLPTKILRNRKSLCITLYIST